MGQASGIILAGGESRRMGRDKAWVELQGRALIQRVADRLAAVCDEVIVVANAPEAYARLGLPVVTDIFPGKGSLGGLYSGLQAARYGRAMAVACDMPFLSIDLIRFMLDISTEYDVVIPSAPDASKPPKKTGPRPTAKDSDLHPLHAVYARTCIRPMEAHLLAGDLRLISFYPEMKVRVLNHTEIDRFDPKHLSLFNVNTPEQLALAIRLAESEAGT